MAENPAEAQICNEYQRLHEKSQKFFAGLRDLPQYGAARTWRPYFQKTFEVYTKLWKFQQEHRKVLTTSDRVQIKRWEIGEIASKIGQLYYHYYLRTSETNYLHESYVFYDAIRSREYFRAELNNGPQLAGTSTTLTLKKLRYYARFIVVCLLLNKRDIVNELLAELRALVEQYNNTFKPTDAQEWLLVLQEIQSFPKADEAVQILAPGSRIVSNYSYRLTQRPAMVGRDSTTPGKLRLQEAIIVGNTPNQVKFSELTVDMFRFLQSLEREQLPEPSAMGSFLQDDRSGTSKSGNPLKSLLYRPTVAQLLQVLACSFMELSSSSVLLLYISASGAWPKKVLTLSQNREEWSRGMFCAAGGVSMNSKKAVEQPLEAFAAAHTVHAIDLVPFTRRPTFFVIDSNNSVAFQNLPCLYGQPLVCLLSPILYPDDYPDPAQCGGLLTLFLTAPVMAFCFVCQLKQVPQDQFEVAVAEFSQSLDAILLLLQSTSEVDPSYLKFLDDEYLRQYILHFAFCHSVFLLHRRFNTKREYFPLCNPPLPPAFIYHSTLLGIVRRMSVIFSVTNQFTDTPPVFSDSAQPVRPH